MRHAEKQTCKRGHPLSGDNVRVEWADKACTRQQRKCMTCERIRSRVAGRVQIVERRIVVCAPGNRALKDQIDILKEENRQLRELLQPTVIRFPTLSLSPRERAILRTLYVNAGATAGWNKLNQLHTPEDCEDTRCYIAMYMSKLRVKLKPLEVAITAVWRQGYTVSHEDAAKLKPFE